MTFLGWHSKLQVSEVEIAFPCQGQLWINRLLHDSLHDRNKSRVIWDPAGFQLLLPATAEAHTGR